MKTIVKHNGMEEVIFEMMNLGEMKRNLADFLGNQTEEEFHLYVEYKDGSTCFSIEEPGMNYLLDNIHKVIFETPDCNQLYNAEICEEGGCVFAV